MVIYLHSQFDDEASKDLARIYDTRTLGKIMAVNQHDMRTKLGDILHARMRVVVPDDGDRICDAMLKVLRCLKLMSVKVHTVDEYIEHLKNPTAPAIGPGARQPEGSGAVRGLPAEAG
jgi:hypothetical protein